METGYHHKKTLGEIVADDYRAASVFKNASLDFCCGGKKTLSEACLEKGISPDTVENQLKALSQTPPPTGHNFKDWDLAFLSDYIVNTHHIFVRNSLPDLLFYTQKIATVHGENHPELIEVTALMVQVNAELTQHLQKEEEVLFPAIKEVLKQSNSGAPNVQALEASRKTIASEIERMNGEHEFAGGALDHINEITHQYKVPADGCNTYEVAFTLLEKFEDDLHIHVHLENNILFPKALQL